MVARKRSGTSKLLLSTRSPLRNVGVCLAGRFHGLRRVHAVRAGQYGREAQHEAVGTTEDGVVELAEQFAEGLAFGVDGLAGLVLELAHAARRQRQRIGAERDDLDDQAPPG